MLRTPMVKVGNALPGPERKVRVRDSNYYSLVEEVAILF